MGLVSEAPLFNSARHTIGSSRIFGDGAENCETLNENSTNTPYRLRVGLAVARTFTVNYSRAQIRGDARGKKLIPLAGRPTGGSMGASISRRNVGQVEFPGQFGHIAGGSWSRVAPVLLIDFRPKPNCGPRAKVQPYTIN